jgi:peptidoglycan/xylan/chitin deacetylase (PgdA/CDA1 family)
MFHYVRPPILQGVSEDLFVSPHQFAQLLDFIVEHFHPLEPEEFFDRMKANQLPKRAVLLTFDDGSIDNVTIALPELQRRNLKACFFICPRLIDTQTLPSTQKLAVMLAKAQPGHYEFSYPLRETISLDLPKEIVIDTYQSRVDVHNKVHPVIRKIHSHKHIIFFDYLSDLLGVSNEDVNADFRLATWEELSRLVNADMLVGNHTLYHSTISADGAEQFEEDVALAFEQLEPLRRISFKVFCFPYGRKVDASEEAIKILQQQQVDFALATQGGIASPQHSSQWSLRRESVWHSIAHFKLMPVLASAKMNLSAIHR